MSFFATYRETGSFEINGADGPGAALSVQASSLGPTFLFSSSR
jgi:hypothetical protein